MRYATDHTCEQRHHRGRAKDRPVANREMIQTLNLLPTLKYPELFDLCVLKRINDLNAIGEVTLTAHRLFICLSRRANRKTGCCYPSVQTLAKELGVSLQAIRQSCRFLERHDFIVVDSNAGLNRTNVYYIDFRAVGGSNSEGETLVSGTLNRFIFGETPVSDHTVDDISVLESLKNLEWDDV